MLQMSGCDWEENWIWKNFIIFTFIVYLPFIYIWPQTQAKDDLQNKHIKYNYDKWLPMVKEL